MTRPPSLGDSPKKYVLKDESWEPPGSREGLLKTIKDIVAGGGVQKIVVELGKPILVKRYVEPEEFVPSEMPVEDIMLAIRSAELIELPFVEGQLAFEQLFRSFLLVSQKLLKPLALVVHSSTELRRWFEVDPLINLSTVYGVEVRIEETCPEDTALLLAGDTGSDQVSYGVRMSMNLPTRV